MTLGLECVLGFEVFTVPLGLEPVLGFVETLGLGVFVVTLGLGVFCVVDLGAAVSMSCLGLTVLELSLFLDEL